MDFSLSEQQEILKKSAREFLDKECPKDRVKRIAQDETGYSPELWEKMAELGWMGLAFPEEFDGTGGSFLDLAVLLEEMGKTPLPGPFFSTVVLAGDLLLHAGSAQQKKDFLPQIVNGKSILTLALTEPSAKYTADGIAVKALPKKHEYEIEGTKLFVPDAHIANHIICAARTKEGKAPEDGITLFVIDAKNPGVKCTLLPTIDHEKQCEVIFTRAAVSKEGMLGDVDKGWSYLGPLLQKATVAKCAEMVGGMQHVLEITTEYVKNRVQYGHPIGSFQAIQHHCANMALYVEGSRWITYKAAWTISQGLDCAKYSAMAKAHVSSAYQALTMLADQCHGAIGLTADHEMPLYFKHAKASQFIMGTRDAHLETVAREANFISR